MTTRVVPQGSPKLILVDGHGTVWPVEEPIPPGYHKYLGTFSERIDLGNKGEHTPIRFCTGIGVTDLLEATRTITRPRGPSVIESGLYCYDLATGERVNHPLLTTEVESALQEIRVSRIPEIVHRLPMFKPYLRKEVHIALDRLNEHVNPADYVNLVAEMLVDFTRFVDVISSGHAIDILVKGVNKGSGMLEMCTLTSTPRGDVGVIGDSPNDLSAMKLAGWAGCVANAPEKFRETVLSLGGNVYVSPYPYVEGVIDIMDHFGLG